MKIVAASRQITTSSLRTALAHMMLVIFPPVTLSIPNYDCMSRCSELSHIAAESCACDRKSFKQLLNPALRIEKLVRQQLCPVLDNFAPLPRQNYISCSCSCQAEQGPSTATSPPRKSYPRPIRLHQRLHAGSC